MNFYEKLSLNRSLPLPFATNYIEKSVPSINVQLFGKLEMWIDDKKIEKWPTRRAKQLLAYLLLNHRKPQSRDVLIEKFWPHSTPDTARNSLNVAIHAIRKAFKAIDRENDYILFSQDHYTLNQNFHIISDVDIFNTQWRKGKYLAASGEDKAFECFEEAISVYNGILLEDNLYDSWAESERNYVQEAYLSMLDRLGEYYFSVGNFVRCLELCEMMLKIDDCREDIYRRMMELYASQGKRTQAIRLYYRCVENLAKELEIMPTEETKRLFEEVKMG